MNFIERYNKLRYKVLTLKFVMLEIPFKLHMTRTFSLKSGGKSSFGPLYLPLVPASSLCFYNIFFLRRRWRFRVGMCKENGANGELCCFKTCKISVFHLSLAFEYDLMSST